MTQPYAHCHFCGAAYQNLAWPRTCAVCGRTAYRNVLPVAVVVQPVDAGLLTVRRAISPGFGELALPGGYINHGETWEAAATRELAEETGLRIGPDQLELFQVSSNGDFLLIFGLAPPIPSLVLPRFVANSEASERVIIERPQLLAFPFHTHAVERYFREHARDNG